MTNPTTGKLNELVNKLCERDKSLNADEVKKQILAWALGVIGEDEVFTKDRVHSVKQTDRKFIINAKIRNQLRAELKSAIIKLRGNL